MQHKITDKIAIKRTDKERSSFSETVLDYGEPLLIQDKYLAIGPKIQKFIKDCLVFKAFPGDIVDHQVFESTRTVNNNKITTLKNENKETLYIDASTVVSEDGSNLKKYIDDSDTKTLSASQQYATNEDAKILNSAKTYAQSQAGDALTSAKAYTDSTLGTMKYAISDSAGGAASYVKVSANTTNQNAPVACLSTVNGKTSVIYNTGIYINCSTGMLMGAAYNDFAEYRKGSGSYGSCVCESASGELTVSKKRLQKCAYVVSDTCGFAIGKVSDTDIPVAISGRVLARPDRQLSKFKIGDAVCSGKNGTVSKMSRIETVLFPECIVGFVSEIPNYDTWNNIKVDNRLWIRVK